ncbi:helix-turn-helix domain-containing protein [Natronobeatus ordinarius]|uniref:helix-turn-helix domain-containing protein n=1 Tax=Natronobeatus ordinarius TaxID=2963433 RepID=UPI0020CDAB21|nr:helix-turn-helix domain-containing protein [Natronobeatus ordinarius]
MAVVSEFEIAADEFALGRLLTSELDVTVDVERVVPSSRRFVPYHWVEGPDVDRFADHVGASDAVESIVELERDSSRICYRIDWCDGFGCLASALERSQAAVLEARGDDRWWFRLRFPSRAALSDFHGYCDDHDVTLSLVRIQPTESVPGDRFELTPEQRRALELAVERGYFTVPRGTTLSALADELDVSTQAASERLRRGTDAVLRSQLLENGPP